MFWENLATSTPKRVVIAKVEPLNESSIVSEPDDLMQRSLGLNDRNTKTQPVHDFAPAGGDIRRPSIVGHQNEPGDPGMATHDYGLGTTVCIAACVHVQQSTAPELGATHTSPSIAPSSSSVCSIVEYRSFSPPP